MKMFLKKLILISKRYFLILSKPKFKFIISKKSRNKKYNILDIGCGGNSPYETKLVFPKARYVGIDRDFNYHNNELSIKLIDKKIKFDLNENIEYLENEIKNEEFDIIIFNHTIEHTYQGLEILNLTIQKLKKEGCIYIEFPSIRSLSLPSMRGTLNFCDDNTHVKLYSVKEIANTLLLNKCKVTKAGRRFNIFSLLFIPSRLFNYPIFNKSPAGIFWDLLGFADFVFAFKRNNS